MTYKSDLYTISLLKKNDAITLGMQIHNNIVNTKDLPHTYDFLNVRVPSVLHTQCFNEENLPFHIEVRNTELGHLFEHILLEKLCSKKLSSGRKKAIFSGSTNWNWKRDPYGLFYITIESKKSDIRFLKAALFDTIEVFNSLLSYNTSSHLQGKPMDSMYTAHR